ncbi:Peptidoglycan-binding protein ArfA [bacterium YEK0313]|nr:Peptidoglycan-binding protein ArfA [bacterium YEK0313]
MRGISRRRLHEDEEESSFVSMTDLTVSFLFIVMILLAYSASKMATSQTVPKTLYDTVVRERDVIAEENARLDAELKELRLLAEGRRIRIDQLENKIAELEARLAEKNPLETYMAQVSDLRRKVLEGLQAQLKLDFPELQVVVSEQMDALRFKGDGLFDSGRSKLAAGRSDIVRRLATRLNEILPCYTLGRSARWNSTCNSVGAIIEAVQIEGHTDVTGSENANVTLSTERANETFFVMKEREPGLTLHQNMRGQPVMSVAGYGAMRPIVDNATPEGRATNRRIDLRIIMYTPQSSDEIESIRRRLRESVGEVPR